MKTLTLLFIYLLLFCGKISAHNELDGMLQQLQKFQQEKNPDSLANIYNDLANYYAYRNPDSLYFYTQLGLKHADKNQILPYVDLLINKMTYFNAIGNGGESLKAGWAALHEAERLKCGELYMGDILSSLGVCYRRTNQPDSALICYNKAVACFEKAGDEANDEMPFLLTSIAILYNNTSRTEEAENYISKAINYLDKTDDLDTHMYVLNSAGGIFTLSKKYNKAKKALLRALEKAKTEKKARFVLQNANALLSLYNRLHEVKEIDRHVKELEPWLHQLPSNSTELMGYYEALANIYASENRFEESNRYYKKILESHENDSQTSLPTLYLVMARNYTGMGNFTEATAFYERAFAAKDSIHKSEISKQLSEFSMKFENQEKQLEITRLNEESFKQKNIILYWVIFAVFLIIICIAIIAYGYIKKKQLKQESELLTAKSFISGLEQERARLGKELHDGVCNDIYGIAMMIQLGENDQETRQEILRGLELVRADVRAISHELTPPQFHDVSIDEVIEHFVSHLTVPQSMNITFHKDNAQKDWNEIPENIAYNTYRILQELMGNILHYSEATFISIELIKKDCYLCLSITNNGKYFDINQNNSKGIGFSTIEERSKLIKAKFTKSIMEGKQFFKLETTWE